MVETKTPEAKSITNAPIFRILPDRRFVSPDQTVETGYRASIARYLRDSARQGELPPNAKELVEEYQQSLHRSPPWPTR